MSEWDILPYDPEKDDAPEGDPDHDCTGEPEEEDEDDGAS